MPAKCQLDINNLVSSGRSFSNFEIEPQDPDSEISGLPETPYQREILGHISFRTQTPHLGEIGQQVYTSIG